MENSQKRILLTNFPRPNEPYGGGNRFLTEFSNLGARTLYEVLVTQRTARIDTQPTDTLIITNLHGDRLGQFVSPSAKDILCSMTPKFETILLRVNDCDMRKNTQGVDETVVDVAKQCHGVIFVSQWIADYFTDKYRHMRDIPSIVVRNGVNPEHFRPGQKFIDGKIHVVSCHWSDNSLKGEWAHRFLDDFVGQHSDRFCYTFIGRSQHKFRHAEHIEPIGNPAELGACLARHHVCINATHADPGPNSVVEPIACGVPTYVCSTGGGAVEFAGADHTFADEAELEALLLSEQFTLNSTRSLFKSWREVYDEVVKFRDSIDKS